MLCVTSARAVCAGGTRGILFHTFGYHLRHNSITVETSCMQRHVRSESSWDLHLPSCGIRHNRPDDAIT